MLGKIKELFNSTITEVPEILNKSYIPALDGFRGIAIITVIYTHTLIFSSYAKYGPGNIGVEVFFVLSGFLITSLLFKEKVKKGKVSFRKFYIRRALRIIPVAYLFLVVLLILNYLFKLNISSGSFIACALYIKNFHLNYKWTWLNGHFWTLSVEEQFYIIFPMLMIYNLKLYIKLLVILILSIPILQYLYTASFTHTGVFYSNYLIHKSIILLANIFDKGTSSILIGSLLSVLLYKKIIPTSYKRFNRYLALTLFLLAMLFRMTYFYLNLNEYLTTVVFSVAIATVIYLTIRNTNDLLTEILSTKVLVKLGILSYSLYIWQQIFIYDQPWQHSFKYSNSLFFNIPMIFIVSYLSYYFYELRFLKLKEKFKAVGYNIDKKIL